MTDKSKRRTAGAKPEIESTNGGRLRAFFASQIGVSAKAGLEKKHKKGLLGLQRLYKPASCSAITREKRGDTSLRKTEEASRRREVCRNKHTHRVAFKVNKIRSFSSRMALMPV